MVEVQWSAPRLLLILQVLQVHLGSHRLVLPGIRLVLLETLRLGLEMAPVQESPHRFHRPFQGKSLHHIADKNHFHKNHIRRHFAGMVHMGRSYCKTNSYPLSSCIPSNVCKTPKQVLVNTQGFDFLLDPAGEGIDLCEIHCLDID
jgi:hypothetical protein